mmetsp:Transcript_20968/g.51346  ORF Transcript_20968/g.51346 Transcript_20968/m.51346 type:complete len:122 (-) Transcript_20968:286-651(-)
MASMEMETKKPDEEVKGPGDTTRRAGPEQTEDESLCCYRKDGILMWSGLTCKEWGYVTLVFLGAYTVLGFFLAAMLAAQFAGKSTTLYVFLALFLVFVFVLGIAVYMGEGNGFVVYIVFVC